MRIKLRLFAPWLLTAVTVGCATTPDAPPVDNVQAAWQQRHAKLRDVNVWQVKGRLAVRTRERGGQVNMLWRRNSREHTINLYGPLGGGRVILTQNGSGATLRDNRKRTYRADTAEALLLRVAGWRVPFREMQHWVLGIPAPGAAYAHTLDDRGRLALLRQAGWEIRFQGYRDFAGVELPDKFRLTALPGTKTTAANVAGGEGPISVKAVIKGWDLVSRPASTMPLRAPHERRSSVAPIAKVRSLPLLPAQGAVSWRLQGAFAGRVAAGAAAQRTRLNRLAGPALARLAGHAVASR